MPVVSLTAVLSVITQCRPLGSEMSQLQVKDFLKTTFIGLAHEPASFWQKNMIAVIILLRVLVRMSWQQKQVIKC